MKTLHIGSVDVVRDDQGRLTKETMNQVRKLFEASRDDAIEHLLVAAQQAARFTRGGDKIILTSHSSLELNVKEREE